jgi:ribosomal protein S18 acetylase RimI-like enzyme
VIRTDSPVKTSHIRLLDIHRDLIPVADLIETCFSNTLDADGREYLRQIRRAAVDHAYLRWIPGASERVSMPLFGYIWEQDRRILGNLSLIPIQKNGSWLYLIANVAVHPEYRRHGIARELTLKALEHIRQHGVSSAWLQVREENSAAYLLYRSTGFVERSRRTTWINQHVPPPNLRDDITVTGRRYADWDQQRILLDEIYPAEVTWNLLYNPGHFNPSFWIQLWRWLNGDTQEHWVARKRGNGQPLGFATWEPLPTLNDQIWIAAKPEDEEKAIEALLPYARQQLYSRGRTININYPAGRAIGAFTNCGFTPLNTLIWMENQLP